MAAGGVGGAADDGDDAVGEGVGAVELVRREQHRRSRRHRPADERVDEVATGLVEARVRLVEQPQLRPARDEAGQRGPPPLSGGQGGDPQVGEAAVEPAGPEGRRDVVGRGARGPAPEAHVVA